MTKNTIDQKYDIRLYPDCTPLATFNYLNKEMEKFKEQFEHFTMHMIPDIYNKIYDLQNRYNDIAELLRELNKRLDDHSHPSI